jgi:transposase
VQVNDVAHSLLIHPFLLSRWRKQVREGEIVAKEVKLEQGMKAELKELRRIKRDYERLKVEHDLLKKAIEFTSERRARSSSSLSNMRPRAK